MEDSLTPDVKLLRKWKEDGRLHCEYEASFWEGPIRAGDKGRSVRRKIKDVWLKGRLLNTSQNVSYYQTLKRMCGQ